MRFNPKPQLKQRWLRRSLFLLASLTCVFTISFSLAETSQPLMAQGPRAIQLDPEPNQQQLERANNKRLLAQAPTIRPPVAQTEIPSPTPSQRPRRVRRSDVWRAVYQQLPYLPEAAQYEYRNGSGAASSTFVQRVILYHNQKGRSVYHRFDWKLTLADFLGANDSISSLNYPSSSQLMPDPLEEDRAVVAQLNRAQRDEFVNLLVSLYNPRTSAPAKVTDEGLGEMVEPALQSFPEAPSQPTRPLPPPSAQPGDAQLLLP